jgi:hypothetical protein
MGGAALKFPDEYGRKPGSSRPVVVARHPTHCFEVAQYLGQMTPHGYVKVPNPDYHPPILYQDGKFFRGSYEAHEEIPKKDVPRYILDTLRRYPPVVVQPVVPAAEVMSPAEVERLFGDRAYENRIRNQGGEAADADDGERPPRARRRKRGRPPRRARQASAAPAAPAAPDLT